MFDSPHVRLVTVCATTLFMFLAMGNSFRVSIGMLVILTSYWILGNRILASVVRSESAASAASAAIRVIIGIVVHVGIALLARPLIGWEVASLILLGVPLVGGAWQVVRTSTSRSLAERTVAPTGHEVVAIATIALLYLGRDYRWANVAFVGLLLVLVGSTHSVNPRRANNLGHWWCCNRHGRTSI